MITDKLIAGDTLDFEDEAPDFPATDGWTLKYRLVPMFTAPVQAPIELTAATYQTTDYRVQVGSATTATWLPGNYNWARWVEQIGMRQSLGEGTIEILADPATRAAGYDGRTHAEKMVAQFDAALLALNSGMKSYSIADRAYVYADLAELQEWREYWLQQVRDEQPVTSGSVNTRMMKARPARGY